VRVGDMM